MSKLQWKLIIAPERLYSIQPLKNAITELSGEQACDLCYTRKLKCNGQQPRCSNCIIYARECTHIAQSRRSKPKARHNDDDNTMRADEVQNLRARVKELEAQLVCLLLLFGILTLLTT